MAGKLMLVGFGPGQTDLRRFRNETAAYMTLLIVKKPKKATALEEPESTGEDAWTTWTTQPLRGDAAAGTIGAVSKGNKHAGSRLVACRRGDVSRLSRRVDD